MFINLKRIISSSSMYTHGGPYLVMIELVGTIDPLLCGDFLRESLTITRSQITL